jgi:hypothetical protein
MKFTSGRMYLISKLRLQNIQIRSITRHAVASFAYALHAWLITFKRKCRLSLFQKRVLEKQKEKDRPLEETIR